MSEPIYSETTERFWGRLPGVYAFEDQNNDWTMKKYIAALSEELASVDHLVDRFNYTPPEDAAAEGVDEHSDLVDPMTADAEWIRWLAQLVGVKFRSGLTEQQQRELVHTALSGVQAGTTAAITQAVQTVLAGTKTVYIYPFSNLSGVGSGTQWEVLIQTLASETGADVIEAVVDAGAKPAGVKLYHQTFGASWDDIEAAYPTWNDWEGKTWQEIESI